VTTSADHGKASRLSNSPPSSGLNWFNHQQLFEPDGNTPPSETKANFDAALETTSDGRITQTKQPPAFSACFSSSLRP
jgi:hypothetical protein